MDIEFHYHVIGLLAVRAGYAPEEARLIAHASQQVDDNDTILDIRTKDGTRLYSNYISQTMNILQPKQTLMRIYPIFHFLPGDPQATSACRHDGKMHVLNTTPGSPLAHAVLQAAFEAPEPSRSYRIGIALHAFADTWAHQNFVGWYDGFNGAALNPAPNIGHADYAHHPDWVGHRWRDLRLTTSSVDNNQRFLAAAQCIFERLCAALGTDGTNLWPELAWDLRSAFGAASPGERQRERTARLERYRDLCPWLPDYHPHAWRDEAIIVDIRGLPDDLWPSCPLLKDRCRWRNERPETTHWWRFQEAVKAHQAFCMERLVPIFTQMGVDLHQH